MKRSTTFPFRVTFAGGIVLMSLSLMIACTDQQAGKDPTLIAKEAIDQAQVKHLESQQAGYAWAQTTVALDAAAEALEADDLPGALSEASRAAALAEASLAQAKAEQTAWLERFPKASAIKTSASTQ